MRLSDNGAGNVFVIGDAARDILPICFVVILFGAVSGRRWLKLAGQVVLIGAVFFFLARAIHTDWEAISEYPWSFELPWLLLSILFFTITYVGHGMGWVFILHLFKQDVSTLPALYVWFKSLLARYVPGNVMMIVGRVMMIKPYGVSRRISFTTIAYEQALLLVSATIVLSIALPLWPDLRAFSDWIWVVLIVPPLAIMMMHPAILSRVGNYAFRLIGREPIEEFLPLKSLLGLVVFYCLIWVASGAALFAMARAVTDQISVADIPITIASVPLAWLASVLFFISPSGLGVREGIYAYTLRFAFDSEGVASAFAILARFWQTLIEIGIVLVTLGLIKLWYEKHEHKKLKRLEVEAFEAIDSDTPG